MEVVVQALPVIESTGRQVMQTPEDVAQMLRLRAAGLGIKSIALKMGCSKNTVRRYLRGGGWVAYKRPEREVRCTGSKHGWASGCSDIAATLTSCARICSASTASRCSLRTVERAVAPFRRELRSRGGDDPIRDGTRPAAADRLRRNRRGDRRRAGQGAPVRGDTGLFAAAVRGGVPATSGSRRGCRVWRAPSTTSAAHARVADRQRQAAGRHPQRADPGSSLQRPLPRVLPLLGRAAEGVCAVPGAHQGQG